MSSDASPAAASGSIPASSRRLPQRHAIPEHRHGPRQIARAGIAARPDAR